MERRAILVGPRLEGVGGLLREHNFAIELQPRFRFEAAPVEGVYAIVEPPSGVVGWAEPLRPGLIGIAADRERLLAAGYDDAVSAPWYPRELAARIRSVHKRLGGVQESAERLRHGPFVLDLVGVTRDGLLVTVTPHERALLRELFRAHGRTLSRETLRHLAWAERSCDARAVDSVIMRLRRRLPGLIETVRSVGYRLAGSA